MEKKYRVFGGIDNGSTGSIGVLGGNKDYYDKIPIKTELNYTKRQVNIDRIRHEDLYELIKILVWGVGPEEVIFLLERPLINPARFQTSIRAARAFESEIIVLERLGIGYEPIDSKPWQKELLPAGTKGEAALKQASFDVGMDLFPELAQGIINCSDADGLLIAEYCRRHYS